MRLYDLTEQYSLIAEMIEDDTTNEALQAMLDGIEGAFDEKVESIVKLMHSKISEHTAVDNEYKRLKQRADKIAKEVDWLENYVEEQMKLLNKDEVKSNLFSIKLALNPPSVKVDELLLSSKYYRIIPSSKTVDKALLSTKLKSGESIVGAWLEQSKSLRIK